MDTNNNLIIIVCGPTASGKTKFAINLSKSIAATYNVCTEIINSDSMQIYNDLKILTAFPTNEELAAVHHNLYGILNKDTKYSIAQWYELAKKEINRIHSLKNIPIICGGTGFYIDGIINGIAAHIPNISAEQLKYAENLLALIERDAFFEQLIALDQDIAKTLHKNNTHKILKAYAVAKFTSKPLSQWWKDNQKIRTYNNCLIFYISPTKELLHSYCNQRIYKMLDAGLIDETSNFYFNNKNYNGPLTHAIGYDAIVNYLENNINIDNMIDNIQIKTRQYAKKQFTWFNNQLKNCYPIESGDILIENHAELQNIIEQKINNL